MWSDTVPSATLQTLREPSTFTSLPQAAHVRVKPPTTSVNGGVMSEQLILVLRLSPAFPLEYSRKKFVVVVLVSRILHTILLLSRVSRAWYGAKPSLHPNLSFSEEQELSLYYCHFTGEDTELTDVNYIADGHTARQNYNPTPKLPTRALGGVFWHSQGPPGTLGSHCGWRSGLSLTGRVRREGTFQCQTPALRHSPEGFWLTRRGGPSSAGVTQT